MRVKNSTHTIWYPKRKRDTLCAHRSKDEQYEFPVVRKSKFFPVIRRRGAPDNVEKEGGMRVM